MRYTQNVGTVASTGDVFKAEKIEKMFVASAAISVGLAVMVETSTSYVYGGAVLPATTAADHAIEGIFEGQTESRGARTAVSGLAGFDALANETVWVTVHGAAVGLCYASTTDSTIAAYDPLDFSGAAGRGRKTTMTVASMVAALMALEAQTASATSGAATDIYVRCM